MPQRLPLVNGDDGQWGDILNQYLEKEHFNDGTDNAANGGHKTITVRAGTTAAGTAPIKLTSGSLMTVEEVGALEFLTDTLYFTQTTGVTRRAIPTISLTGGATGDIYYRNASSQMQARGIGSTGDVLRVVGGVPEWQAPGTSIDINMSVGTSAPGSPATGDLWVDTN